MEPLTFDYENLHFRVDRGVFEAFDLIGAQQSLRLPLQWLGVLIFFKKPGKPGQLFIGTVRNRDANLPLYGTDRLDLSSAATSSLQISADDEARFREFFTKVAEVANRRVAA
ncbi:hypothetical protein [Kribbella sp. CA-293567]|uniref:hypothetical protein n=1 Tax=Kribbella sp. CA-293567 TaxID=3002436 RepID=UPI0022DD0A8A|nr:hypothetical protein [Kribbella sp. CA-293567]WBQ05618.1 hypothetical protein OX958_02190 [Kribbella sp. CA-293567]